MVLFKFYDFKGKNVVMETEQDIKIFGFPNAETARNETIMNVVRQFLSKMNFADQPIQRILSSLKELKGKKFKEDMVEIAFIDPQYMTSGIKEVGKIEI